MMFDDDEVCCVTQPVLTEEGGAVKLTKYPATHAGVVDSFVARFAAVDVEFEREWQANRSFLE